MLPLRPPDDMLSRAVCPRCHSAVSVAGPGLLACGGCDTRYPQPGRELVTLCVPDALARDPAWEARQRTMADAYRELIADADHARRAYQNDLAPFMPLLEALEGPVLDLGGGNGLLRHYLPAGIDYLSVDPDPAWLDGRWLAIADTFPCLRSPLSFLGGFGEALPLPTAGAGAVVSFWSLNHARSPPEVLAEACRVLAPGGTLLVVLDDVPPGWRDILARRYRDVQGSSRRALLLAKARSLVSGWPRQPDHLPVSERDVRRWLAGRCAIVERGFLGSYFWIRARR